MLKAKWEPDSGRLDCCAQVVALLGCVFLFLGIPLHGPLMLFDVLVPFMACQLWRKRELLRSEISWHSPLFWVALAAGWVALATTVQLSRGAQPLYDTAIFLYLLLTCAFYCVTPLPSPRHCAVVAFVLLAICLAGLLVGTYCGGSVAARLFYTEANLLGQGGDVLSRRYQFFFTNPNLLGSAFVLPVVLAMPWLAGRLKSADCGWRRLLLIAAAMLVASLPLLHSVSKHLLMSFGMLFGVLCCFAPLRRLGRWMAPALTVFLGVLFAFTVWFRTYPAMREAPWVDFHGRSNYSTHQEVYLDIVRGCGFTGMLFGHGADELRELYPKYVDKAKVASILEAYYGHKLDGVFTTFMDPHNEYLNTASQFGIPALVLMAAAVCCLMCRGIRHKCIPCVCFCVALAFSCLWDDLASKRWMWIAAAVLARRQSWLSSDAE